MLLSEMAELKGFDPRLRKEGDSCNPSGFPCRKCFDPRLRKEGDF